MAEGPRNEATIEASRVQSPRPYRMEFGGHYNTTVTIVIIHLPGVATRGSEIPRFDEAERLGGTSP